MSVQEIREQFEEWHNRATAELVKAGEIVAARRMQAFKPIMLGAWEASREAVVVELPLAMGGRMWVSQVVESIAAQGLKVAE